MKIFKHLVVVVGIVGLVGLILGYVRISALIESEARIDPNYSNRLLDIELIGKVYFLNDLVGVSPRREGLPGAFLLKHSTIPYVVRSTVFTPAILETADSWGISQDPIIKGWGGSHERITAKTGLTLGYLKTMLVGDYAGSVSGKEGNAPPPSVEIYIPWKSTHHTQGAVTVETIESAKGSRFLVELHGPGSFWMESQPPPTDGFPIHFLLKNIEVNEVSIGEKLLHPDAHSFQLQTRDMHSIAFGEFNGKPDMEASIVRGGIRDQLEQILPDARDMVIDLSRHQEITGNSSAIHKRACRGRQSAWVDIDGDRDLDLYIVCGGHAGSTDTSANQLYIMDNGQLTEMASTFGLAIRGGGAFLFVDWDQDQDLDFWWASENGDISYYQNNEGLFSQQNNFKGVWAGGHRSPQFLLGDIDFDLDPDIFLIHPRQGTVIRNDGADSKLIAPATLGLPEKARAAAWVDIDLDGFVDLITVSKGVYLGNSKHRFERVESKVSNSDFIRDSRIVSFAGATGRQFLTATSYCLPGLLCKIRQQALILWRQILPDNIDVLINKKRLEPKDWFIHLYDRKPIPATHREVAFTLHGSPYNPLSAGASLSLKWLDHQQKHWVGESETSLFSQANYDIYASVPIGQEISAIASWQDGCTLRFYASGLSTRVAIARPSECDSRNRINRSATLQANVKNQR